MVIIHTVLANGQCIMSRAMEGVLNQTIECCLMPITSQRDWNKHYRANIIDNWREAFRHCDEPIFVGMDSDVILKPEAVETLIKTLEENRELSMVGIPSKPRRVDDNRRRTFHQLFAIRREALPKFNDLKVTACPLCQVVDRMKGKVKFIQDIRLNECARKFVRRRNV